MSHLEYRPGDLVLTPFGKGIVVEVRNAARLLVRIGDRQLECKAAEIRHAELTPKKRRARTPAPPPSGHVTRDDAEASQAGARTIDLHGLTVESALAAVEQALNDALLEDRPALRVIHGRSGGRIRDAVHRYLRHVPSVRHYRIDPRNPGVTLIEL